MDTMTGDRRITYDARGLVEPVAEVPKVSEIDGEKATFDAADLTTRQINLELRWLIYEQGARDVTVLNPGAKHSIGVGILQRCKIRFEGRLGYFGLGLIDGPEITVTGRVGWSVCENMMSGVVVIEKNAGSLTGAAMRGGDLIVKGAVGARTGIDQKGGTIIVGGDAGTMTAFMMQRGRQIILRQRRQRSGRLDVRRHDLRGWEGEVARHRLRRGRVDRRRHRADRAEVPRSTASATPPPFQKFVCGKELYNYDNLEPSERKLVI